MIAILILYAMFALTFTLGKECLAFMPPISFIGFRMMIAGALLLCYSFFKQKQPLLFKKKDLFWFVGIILFHIYISFIFEFLGLSRLVAAKACLLFNLMPFVTAIISYFFFKEIITFKKGIGFLIGFLGFLPILLESTASTSESLTSSFGFLSLPELYILISVVSSAFGWIILKRLTHQGYSYFYVNGVAMLVGGMGALVTGMLLEVQPDYLACLVNLKFLRPFLMLLVVGNFICYNLYGKLLKKYTATLISFFGFFTPLFAAFFDWFLLGQVVGINFYISVFIITIGLYLYYQEELKQGYIVQE